MTGLSVEIIARDGNCKTLLSKFRHDFDCTSLFFVGHDNAVGTATHCGLDGPGIESRWGQDLPHPSRPALEPTQPPIQWVPVLSRGGGVKRPGCGVDQPPHLAPMLMKE
jgi:hypothetical protein